MTEKIERAPMGISGLDKILGGGIPKGFSVLVEGAPGTGKTIMGMQFLNEGLKRKEKCIYLALDESIEKVLRQARQMGLCEGEELIAFSARDLKYEIGLGKKPEGRKEQLKLALEKIKKIGPDRLVVDPLNSLLVGGDANERSMPRFLIEELNKLGSTNLLLGEVIDSNNPDNVTPFLVDGDIKLTLDTLGTQISRSLTVQKMRMTKCDIGTNNLEIVGGKGIKVEPTK